MNAVSSSSAFTACRRHSGSRLSFAVARRSAGTALRRAFAAVFVLWTLICAAVPVSLAAEDTRPYIGDRYGVKREDIVRWLSSHEHDNYYLGTPYHKLAYTAPRGDPYCALSPAYSTGGVPGMNCAGFVAHVVYKAGLDVTAWNNYLRSHHPALYNRQNYNIASADMWYLHVTGDDTGYQGAKELTGAFRYYSFPSIQAALESGKMRKGDLFIFWPKEGYAKDRVYQDSHIGVYWGDYSGQNKFWHMHWPVDEIGPIYSFVGPYDLIIVPFSADTDGGTLNVTERNEDGAKLAGARFTATNSKTGASYAFGPTDADGLASVYLPTGSYTVKHTTYPSGYAAGDVTSWSVTVAKGKTVSLATQCARPRGTLEITQTDGEGNGLRGAIFRAVRSDGKTVEFAATDSKGVTRAKLLPGTYTVTQTTLPAHYVAKGATSWKVTVSAGKTATLATYAIPAKGALSISVVDVDGEGLAGIWFSVRDAADADAEPVAEIKTDLNGDAVYGLEGGEYTLEHGAVYYLRYERSGRGDFVPDTKTYRVAVRGGETVRAAKEPLTLRAKSEITLSDELPEGEYAVYTDAECTVAATVPNEDLTADVPAYISTGETLTIGEGTYYLRLNEDLSAIHDATIVTYMVRAREYVPATVTEEGAVSESYVRHRFDRDGETATNENGFTTHLCPGCGEQILFGDVNLDGKLNAKDVTLIMRSLTGIKVNMDASTRDVNGDGKYNAKDVILLMKLVVGMK